MQDTTMIGLAEAALWLRMPYQDTHRLLLTGQLTGEKRGGRWYVHTVSVTRLRETREQDLTTRRAG